jgi:alkylation response protein AidB-like acyl-CoA dehydrogenase
MDDRAPDCPLSSQESKVTHRASRVVAVEAVAAALSEQLRSTASERDRQGGTPKRERDLIRASGLLSLSIPREYGGQGADFATVLRVVRRLANSDGSLAHVYAFHHLLLATVRLYGSREQWQEAYVRTAKEELFWGNALNPLDKNTRLVEDEKGYWIEGRKTFCSGANDSDMLIVSALRGNEDKLVVMAIPTTRGGIHPLGDWDNMGQRQTDSGTVVFERVTVKPSELLVSPGPFGNTFSGLRPCIAQLILANVYLGIAEGALREAKSYTLTERRAWPASHVSHPSEDPYVLQHFGNFWLELEAARHLLESAATELDSAWQSAEALTPEQRGNVAIRVAAAKVASTRASLDVTTHMFDVMGARATTAKLGMDRFFRNVRTHTLHDPVEYKLRELGEYALSGTFPVPSFYS